MFNKYSRSDILINDSDSYSNILKEKDLQFIKQYSFKPFSITREKLSNLSYVSYKIKPFERLYNISQTAYGVPQYGWVILRSNFLSSEFELSEGMTISIYYPLLSLLGA